MNNYIEIKMPALSPTMTKGKLLEWKKNLGDKIKAGDVLFEIETDKAVMEYESSEQGFLAQIIINNNMNNETSDLSKFNQVPYRLDCIKKMVEGSILDSMIDFNNKVEDQYGGSDDIRELLPKKYIDFNKAIKELGGKFNSNLKGQAGWIFSNLNKEKVTDFVSNKNKENINK